jgi:hypothetical protein
MGTRGVIRDIVGIYLGFEIIRGYISHNFTLTPYILIAGLILLLLGLWFILERIGISPKIA